MIVIKPILALSLVAFALASPLIQPRQGGNGNEVDNYKQALENIRAEIDAIIPRESCGPTSADPSGAGGDDSGGGGGGGGGDAGGGGE